MDLTSYYLGLKLRTPLVIAASPLSTEIDNLRRMEDLGASAVVLRSCFEEQLHQPGAEANVGLEEGSYRSPGVVRYFPGTEDHLFGLEEYLQHIAQAKNAVDIPIVASLNSSSPGGWTNYAKQMQAAGADALELNIYRIPTEMDLPGAELEQACLDVVKSVKSEVTIPVAVKLSPFFSNFANMAGLLDEAGANGLVLFSRFYQPDIDLEFLDVRPNVLLSTPMAMRLPLRWIALLFGRVRANLAATSGIHRGTDALKMLLAGADVTMLCSVLLRHGIGQIKTIERELVACMEDHQLASVQELRGSLSQLNCPDPSTFERAQYARAITRFPFRNK